ncbi:DHA2 family efflux MFS transporter permease subunit [Streptomyces johnsoniae]|uniref:DHA2 family efflux MFS transporter permease subunit n=1 Tax=Streptomyces johnsoniae TaxID=3075532 RepID=A0ABU2S0Y8_9ACTN|nr:DHA2 family efflux MFS transporter permease subunit [Streptomyces sp. DSM 41886]MDT0442567.1 DHA2 family efflux MFS transporter permease subunit [Streptomyces sp. DSM 41886]
MSSPPDGSVQTHYDNPRRWWALGALAMASLVLGFDTTILNVALPTLAADLGATTTEQQWIIDSFLIVFAATMLPAGMLGDRYGRRRLLVIGLMALLAGSLFGTLVDSAEMLIVARTVMGLGAALVAPLALSVVPTLFGPADRPKAIAVLAAALAAGLPLGPLLGGWLLDNFWWGSVFLINVPMAAIGIVACLLLVPESKDLAAPKVDALSTVLSVGGLASLVFGIIEGSSRGWDDLLVIGFLVGSVILLTALVLRERRQALPMFDLALLRNPGFAWNAVSTIMATLILTGLLFVVPQYLQAVRGESAMGTGVRLMPMMGGLLVAARACNLLVKAIGSRTTIVIGLLFLSLAGFIGSTTDVDSSYALAATWLTITGLGTGLTTIPAMDAALAHLPPGRSGVGSGLLMTGRQVGSAIGVALLGSVLSQVYQDNVSTDGLPGAAAEVVGESVVAAHLVAAEVGGTAGAGLAESANVAFMDAMSATLLFCAIGALVIALLVAWLMPSQPPGQEGTADTPDGDGAEDARREDTTGGASESSLTPADSRPTE